MSLIQLKKPFEFLLHSKIIGEVLLYIGEPSTLFFWGTFFWLNLKHVDHCITILKTFDLLIVIYSYLLNKAASFTVLCSVVKHSGSGRVRKKCTGKHQASVFPCSLSAPTGPTCTTSPGERAKI